MRYTKKELSIIEAIAAQQEENLGADRVELDTIIDTLAPELEGEEKLRFRRSVNASMRNLERKLRSDGLTLVGSGEVGRGNKAYYSIEGSFRNFLNAREGKCNPSSTSSSIGSKTVSEMNAS